MYDLYSHQFCFSSKEYTVLTAIYITGDKHAARKRISGGLRVGLIKSIPLILGYQN